MHGLGAWECKPLFWGQKDIWGAKGMEMGLWDVQQ